MAARRERREVTRPGSTVRALLWTAGSAVLPGIAHLRTGRRAAGWTLLGLFAALVAAGAAAAVLLGGDLARSAHYAVQGRWLFTASAVAFGVAVLWMTVVVHSWVITRPASAGRAARFSGGVVVLAICLAIATPAAAVMRTAYTAYDTLTSVFGADALGEPHDAANPWAGRERVNVLLLGGDSGSNRYGMRTDSMMVASIDVEYGDVVLVGLPRNLENTPFPEGTALAEAYPPPGNFTDLLNEVYQAVAEDPERLAVDPDATDPAADTLKDVIGGITGLELDYYALVDMKGFEGLIDAIGGIDVHIDEPIPYGQEGAVLEAGDQHLDGNEALWYGRSRVNSDDYARMGRQGCLIKYVAEQADPATVLTGFQDLAGATKRTLRTDIPQSKLPAFIELADLVADEGDMRTMQLSPPQVDTAYPDWAEIRRLVAEAVEEQETAQEEPSGGSDDVTPEPSPSAQESPEPSPGAEGSTGSTEWQDYTGLPDPSPTTPGRQVGDDATSLDALCP
ncbi:LCP family protein [Nocardiopsis trehalosi]|jgi:LCP family protein required for cell wall assembly|uniref:LCP family protein n=1 Tax=Nocardiopsis trehalosi TaxID=109329 RepID=UPI000831D557|nr:LCP family protein [Nocardiopsis trehalosi]